MRRILLPSSLTRYTCYRSSASPASLLSLGLPLAKRTLTMQSEEQWQAKLSKEQFKVLRQKDTERAGTGKYNKHYPKSGTYQCAGCDADLFTADHKFDSGCGWPAFFDSIPGAVKRLPDADGRRVEIVCANCDGHLGHVFKGEGFSNPTDERHCVNSVSLNFKE